ncbi:MAG: Crp/Fnr family transcriptional regulator [Caldicoprobacterales bacterium]|jgi:CRP/FNR family cyclic AMP-dependent transcriptional regulator|nr:Crp/Fnr family transcriptional regulator [Clostridiales bacterium]
MIDKLSFLKKIPYFTDISDAELKAIADIMIERTFQRGSLLFMEGEFGEAVHFVMEGKVKIYKTSEDGREHILYIAVPGDIFAEVILFNEVNYPATAEVLEQARIAVIRNEDLEQVLKDHPPMAVAIIKVLNKRLMDAQQQVKSLALHNTHGRTAQMLIKLAMEHGSKTENGMELDLVISRQELANMVGTTRETVTRVLMAFKKYQLIEIDRNTIRITQPDKLKEWIN